MQNRSLFFILLPTLVLSLRSSAVESDPSVIPDTVPHVIGGVDAAIEDYPWLGALVFNSPTDFTGQFCGGTAIDPYWVLTATHCIDESRDLEDFQIVFNTTDLNDGSSAYVAYPSLLVLHSDYISTFNRENDIALIQLREPLPPSIPIINLANSPDLEIPGLSARIVGWGRTTSDPISPDDTDILQQADVSIVSNEFANLEEYHEGRVSETMIAAGYLDPFRSTFRGDSGGPLIVFNDQLDRWEQIGITSWGAGCSKPDNPISVFTRVSAHLDWIDAVIERDFLTWTNQNGISQIEDEQPYSPLMKYIFDVDPASNEPPAWLTTAAFDTNGQDAAVFAPITHRSSVPKFGFHYEFSSDLLNWEDLQLDWSSINTRPGENSNTTDYLLPMVTSNDESGFFRLRHDNFSGLIRGPTTLGIGTVSHGIFNIAPTTEGASRYDYVLDHLGSDLPVQLQIESNRSDKIRLQLIELETDNVFYDDIRTATTEDPLYVSFSIGEGKTVGVRVESTQSDFEQVFELLTGFFRDVPAESPGTSFQGRISENDSSYLRKDHYSKVHTYTLSEDIPYLIEMESSDLDAVFYLRDREAVRTLEDVDNEMPGITERHVFLPEDSLDLEIVVSSWFPNDTGDYTLSLSPFAEPTSIGAGDNILGIFDTSDDTDEQNGTLFYINRITLEGLSPQNEYELFVNGRDGLYPQMAILNLTEQETDHFAIARCDGRYYTFRPADGNNYLLLVITSERNLGKVFEVEMTIVDDNQTEQSNDTLGKHPIQPTATVAELELLYSIDFAE